MSEDLLQSLRVYRNALTSPEGDLFGQALEKLNTWSAGYLFEDVIVNAVLIDLTNDMLAVLHRRAKAGMPLSTPDVRHAKAWGSVMVAKREALQSTILRCPPDEKSRLARILINILEAVPLIGRRSSDLPPLPPLTTRTPDLVPVSGPGPNGVRAQIASGGLPMPSKKMFLPAVGGWDPAGLPSGFGVLPGAHVPAGTRQMSPVIQAASPASGSPAEASPPISNLLRRDPLPSWQAVPRTNPLVPTNEHGHLRRASAPLYATTSAPTTYPAPRPPFAVPVAGPSKPSLYQRRQQSDQGDPSRTFADPLPMSTASPSFTAINPRLPPPSPQHPEQRPDAAAQSLADLALHRPLSRPQPVKLPKPSIAALRYLRGDRVVGQIMLSRYFDGTDAQNEALYKSLMEDLDKLERVGHPSKGGVRTEPERTADTLAVDGPARTAPAHDRPSSAVPARPSRTTLSMETRPALAGSGSFTRTVYSDLPEPILTPSATPSPLFASHPLETMKTGTNDPRTASDSTIAHPSGLPLKLKFRRPPPTAPVAHTDPEASSVADDTPLAQQQSRKKRRTLSPRPAPSTRADALEQVRTPRTNDDTPPALATESQTGGAANEGPPSDDDLPLALLRSSPVRRRSSSSRTHSLAPEGDHTPRTGNTRLPRAVSLPVLVAEPAGVSTKTVPSPTTITASDKPSSSASIPAQALEEPRLQGGNKAGSSLNMKGALAGGVSLATPPAVLPQSRSGDAVEAPSTGVASSAADGPTEQDSTLAEGSSADVQQSTEAIADGSVAAEEPATDLPANRLAISTPEGPSGEPHTLAEAEEAVDMEIDEVVAAEPVARLPSTVSPPPAPQPSCPEIAQEVITTDTDLPKASSDVRVIAELAEYPHVADDEAGVSSARLPAEEVASAPASPPPPPPSSQVSQGLPRMPSPPIVNAATTSAEVIEEQDAAMKIDDPRPPSPVPPVADASSTFASQFQATTDGSSPTSIILPPASPAADALVPAPSERASSGSASPFVVDPVAAPSQPSQPKEWQTEKPDEMIIDEAAPVSHQSPPPADDLASPRSQPDPASSAPPPPRHKARPPPPKTYAPPPKAFSSSAFMPRGEALLPSDGGAVEDAQARIDALLGKWAVGQKAGGKEGTGVVDLGWVWR